MHSSKSQSSAQQPPTEVVKPNDLTWRTEVCPQRGALRRRFAVADDIDDTSSECQSEAADNQIHTEEDMNTNTTIEKHISLPQIIDVTYNTINSIYDQFLQSLTHNIMHFRRQFEKEIMENRELKQSFFDCVNPRRTGSNHNDDRKIISNYITNTIHTRINPYCSSLIRQTSLKSYIKQLTKKCPYIAKWKQNTSYGSWIPYGNSIVADDMRNALFQERQPNQPSQYETFMTDRKNRTRIIEEIVCYMINHLSYPITPPKSYIAKATIDAVMKYKSSLINIHEDINPNDFMNAVIIDVVLEIGKSSIYEHTILPHMQSYIINYINQHPSLV